MWAVFVDVLALPFVLWGDLIRSFSWGLPTHRLLWSEFTGVDDRDLATYSSRRFSRTTHYVGLTGTSKEYKFGSELNAQQRAFVVTFLREHIFGRAPGN